MNGKYFKYIHRPRCNIYYHSYSNRRNDSAVNLSGYSVAAQIRKSHQSTSSVAFTASVSDASAEITISLTPTQTTALEQGRYVYDVLITASGGTKTRVVEGQVTVNPSVTR